MRNGAPWKLYFHAVSFRCLIIFTVLCQYWSHNHPHHIVIRISSESVIRPNSCLNISRSRLLAMITSSLRKNSLTMSHLCLKFTPLYTAYLLWMTQGMNQSWGGGLSRVRPFPNICTIAKLIARGSLRNSVMKMIKLPQNNTQNALTRVNCGGWYWWSPPNS